MGGDGWDAPPPGPLAAGRGDVHVWRVPLRVPEADLARLERRLDAAERARAARFRFPVHRDAFVVGRAAQREILARYLRVDPAEIAYEASEFGKLSLAGAAAGDEIRFNASNADDLALVAVTRGREVGVDLERARPIPDAMEIAARFFSAPEHEVLRRVPPEGREEAFLRCWTRKEAFVKAVGEGLSMPLPCFDVAFAPGEDARLLATRGRAGEAERWTMAHLDPAPGYVGALAVEGEGWSLLRLAWTP